jgi:hypothetical protein
MAWCRDVSLDLDTGKTSAVTRPGRIELDCHARNERHQYPPFAAVPDCQLPVMTRAAIMRSRFRFREKEASIMQYAIWQRFATGTWVSRCA